MASQGPTTKATSASGVTTDPKPDEAGSRPSAGQTNSMAGKRKSPERETAGAVPGTPMEVQAVGQLISVPASGAGGQAGARAGEQAGGQCARHAGVPAGQCPKCDPKIVGVMGHPKDGPVLGLPWTPKIVTLARWKYCGYRRQDNSIKDHYNLTGQKIPEEELKKMYIPLMWDKEKEKIKTKFDLIAKVIHPRYQEYSLEHERVNNKFQQLCKDCNRYGIKCGEIEEFLNYVAQNRETAEKLGIKQ